NNQRNKNKYIAFIFFVKKKTAYEIHIRQTGKVEEISEQLVSKLTTVIQKSSIFKQDGMMQLQLQINPTQLGHITVRMAEVNGEIDRKNTRMNSSHESN